MHIHDHVDLDDHLDPQDGLESPKNHKIWIPLEKLLFTRIRPKFLP